MKQLIALVPLCLSFLAIPGMAADIKTEYSHSTDFTQYKTFFFVKEQSGDALWQDLITRDILAQLVAKGWKQVDTGGDVAVVALGVSRKEQTVQSFYDKLGGGWQWREFADGKAAPVEKPQIGTLLIDLYDAKSQKLIWRTVAADTLSEVAAKNEKQLDDVTRDIFKRFPPSAQGER